MTHTPGEWYYDRFAATVYAPSGEVCFLHDRDGENLGEDDGPLLAASKDLLAACEAAVEAYEPPFEDCGCYECETGRLLRAAIDKAKGETT